jgi:hypothetical protein
MICHLRYGSRSIVQVQRRSAHIPNIAGVSAIQAPENTPKRIPKITVPAKSLTEIIESTMIPAPIVEKVAILKLPNL